MNVDLGDLNAFVAVTRAGGFREGARMGGGSASGLSEAVRRLEEHLGVRLLNRSTRSVALTDAGKNFLERLRPALSEIEAALDGLNSYRDRPAGTLRLNAPVSAARLVLPRILWPFLAAHPEVRIEVITEESFVDVLAAGCDAGIRYEERLEQDMVAVPIGPRVQRFAAAASRPYLDRHGRPQHPRDLLKHAGLRHRFPGGATAPWEFERDGEIVRVDPTGPLVVTAGGASDLAIEAAIADLGVVVLFEDWLRPYIDSGALEPVLEQWWQPFSGPFLYYPGRRLLPAPLRAFVDFIKGAVHDTGQPPEATAI